MRGLQTDMPGMQSTFGILKGTVPPTMPAGLATQSHLWGHCVGMAYYALHNYQRQHLITRLQLSARCSTAD